MYFFFNWVENYSTLKTNEIPTHAATWMNLENITLSTVNQTGKDKCCVIPLTEVPAAVKCRDRTEGGGSLHPAGGGPSGSQKAPGMDDGTARNCFYCNNGMIYIVLTVY